MCGNNIYNKNYAGVNKFKGDIGVPELLSVKDKQLLGL